MPAAGSYKMGGNDLYDTYNIVVEKVKGHMDMPKRKRPTSFSYPDSDGEEAYTDTADINIEARDIILWCRLQTDTVGTFEIKWNAFRAMLLTSGLKTLNLPYPTAQNFSVYCRDGVAMDMKTKWIANKYIGKFILKLHEPVPTRAS